MKKILFAMIIGVIMISLASSCACKKKYSEAYYQVEKLIDGAVKDVNHVDDCDDLDNLVLGTVFGLLSIPDVDKLNEKESAALDKQFEKMSAAFDKRRAALGCEDDDDDD